MISTRLLDYSDAHDARVLVQLLDAYAQDPMGGGEPLSDHTRESLATVLSTSGNAFSYVAEHGGEGVGLINCFTTVSTFAARPLVNVHDVYVAAQVRGQGVVDALFNAVEQEARARGACKITLEVLEGNARAQSAYRRLGFSGYALDDATGCALFWERKLT